ncbi:hypothetical protein IAD21_03870 [Abditibacteriota bacterium]|nr:hypothetical protein IAD21_03870 [Abditibacteriota bacterium]
MSANSSGRPPRFVLPLLGILVLVSGGLFFQSNWGSAPRSNAVALAAPKPGTPKGAVNPKPATKAERTAAQKTIAAQLSAFNKGNWTEAVKFQSAGLKGNFSSPEAFGQMIEQVYPAFVRPKKVEYGRSINVAGHIQFEVSLTGQDDSVTRAIYSLVKEKGNYRVESVMGGAAPQSDPDGNASVV